MGWSRTIRIDAVLDDEQRSSLAAALREAGASIRFGPQTGLARTYALIEAGDEIIPETIEECIADGRLYDEAIIAVAIEPTPADALHALEDALGGTGRPSGVVACERNGSALVIEVRPGITAWSLMAALIEVELRRFAGHRKTILLAPLPLEVTAAIAADGLQAAQIAPDRILEELLERADAD